MGFSLGHCGHLVLGHSLGWDTPGNVGVGSIPGPLLDARSPPVVTTTDVPDATCVPRVRALVWSS